MSMWTHLSMKIGSVLGAETLITYKINIKFLDDYKMSVDLLLSKLIQNTDNINKIDLWGRLIN